MKFLKEYLGLTDEQIELINKEDATNEQLIEVVDYIAKPKIDLYRNSQEYKDTVSEFKKNGYAEGSIKVKKGIAKSLGLTVEDLDKLDVDIFASKIKESFGVDNADEKYKALEQKYFEANNKISENEDYLKNKEEEIKNIYKTKYENSVISKKRAEFLMSIPNTIIDKESIDLVIKGKEALGLLKFALDENDEVIVLDKDGNRMVNEKKNGYLSYNDYMLSQTSKYITNNNGKPTNAQTLERVESEKGHSNDFLNEIERYKSLGIQVGVA